MKKHPVLFWVATIIICGAIIGTFGYFGLDYGDVSSAWGQTTSISQTVGSERKPQPIAEKASTTVYVTRTGQCYHRQSCSYLRRSCIPMDLKNAKLRYRPCSKCNPPK